MNTPVAKTFQQPLTTAFDPRSIPGCTMWLDAADSNTVILSGSSVTQWNDKSGNGYTATASAGTGPTFTTTINSVPCISSPNTKYLTLSNFNQNFTTATSFWIMRATQDIANIANYPGYVILNGIASGNIQTGLGLDTASFIYATYLQRNGASLLNGTLGARASYNPVNDTMICSHILTGTLSTSSVFKNGTSLSVTGTNGTLSNQASVTMYVAGTPSGSFGYDLGEVLVYNSVLTTAQVQQVEGYLASKWKMTSSFPATHPFKLYPPITRAFGPADISGCVLWIDAADATTVTLSGNNITQLLDKSSNARVFATASGFTYDVVKFNTSYPSFYSPTSTAGFSLGSNASFTLNQPFTTFAVGGNLIAPGSGGYFWDSTSNANRGALLSFSPGRPTMFSGVELFSTNSNSFTNALIISSYYNSTSSTLYEFGVDRSSNNNVGTQNISSLRLGAAWPLTTNWNGHICEIVFFNRLLSTTERQQMEGYLANKWGLRGSLASTHPFKLYNPVTPAFTPVQISGLNVWLDAADRTTLTLSGSNVTTWADKSGNGQNATGFNNPTYNSTSNGVDFVRASSQYMTIPNNAVPIGNTSYSYFFIFTPKSTVISQTFFCMGSNATLGNSVAVRTGDAGTGTLQTYWVGFDLQTSSTYTLNVKNFGATYYASGGARSLWLNFLQGASDTPGTRSQVAGPNVIGSALGTVSFLDAQIHEFIVYNTSLPIGQRQAVEGYLAHKWGLVSSLPASHPYKKFIN